MARPYEGMENRIIFSIDKETEALLRKAAEQDRMSLSAWLRNAINEKASTKTWTEYEKRSA